MEKHKRVLFIVQLRFSTFFNCFQFATLVSYKPTLRMRNLQIEKAGSGTDPENFGGREMKFGIRLNVNYISTKKLDPKKA